MTRRIQPGREVPQEDNMAHHLISHFFSTGSSYGDVSASDLLLMLLGALAAALLVPGT